MSTKCPRRARAHAAMALQSLSLAAGVMATRQASARALCGHDKRGPLPPGASDALHTSTNQWH